MNIIDKIDDVPTFFCIKEDVFSDEDLSFVESLNYIKGDINVTREQLWFQQNKEYFCKRWISRFDRWESNDYFEELINLQNKVQKITNMIISDNNLQDIIEIPKINSCLINYYKDGKSFIPPHKDTPISFGRYPVIIGVSFGDTRIFTLKNKKEKYSFELKSNSIFMMAGSSQKYYTHEVEPSDSTKSRYSLTFREYKYS